MKRTSITSRRRAGFAIVPVIAVLAVLAVLGVSLVAISTTHQIGAALDLQGVRAYHAARGGLEWALFQVLQNARNCPDIDNHTLDFADNLAGFHTTIRCTSSAHTEAGAAITLFQITATGCTESPCPTAAVSPPLSYASRQLRVTVGRP